MTDVKIPSPGESITEVELATWLVNDGDLVKKDQELAEIESDKATLMLNAPDSGKISILVEDGSTIPVGEVACRIDTSVEVEEDAVSPDQPEKESEKTDAEEAAEPGSSSLPEDETAGKAPPEKAAESETGEETGGAEKERPEPEGGGQKVRMTPLAREKMKAAGLSVDDIVAGLKKLSVSDVDAVIQGISKPEQQGSEKPERTEGRKKMSQLRKKLSQRLVSVRNETAMLTTFNEVDMSALSALRKKYQESFVEKHGLKLGFMSLFMKASALVLKERPMVNSMIDGEEIVTPRYVDISVAVQTPRGLMVPVVRNVDHLSLAAIEKKLKELAGKAREGKISLEEMSGGTFTITNGGVFGSMLSTPLINPPQSAILGMHNIVDRPVAINGQVEVRPVMYVALSYDHRLIDGKDSVGFLTDVKEVLEHPEMLISDGKDPWHQLLEL
ncbi:MAG: 2-oxoglutarate dehydrogenase complex dihydrolipoyllysine-residue succinyltransferase [Marinilabilia sp.]